MNVVLFDLMNSRFFKLPAESKLGCLVCGFGLVCKALCGFFDIIWMDLNS